MKNYILIAFLGLAIIQSWSVAATDDTCGLAKPIQGKTCVSIRLPWHQKPIFFCVDKDKFKYRNQCPQKTSYANSCYSNGNKNSLKVATPWDCCPIESNPDSCANHDCPPAPYNRTCQSIPPKEDQIYECCNTHFCEEDTDPDMCHFKQLESECNTPPEGKTNCIAFIDEYGCCPKYQCDGDSFRPGHCPAEVEAIKYMNRFNDTTKNSSSTPAPPSSEGEADTNNDAGGAAVDGKYMANSKMAASYIWWPPVNTEPQISCIGDFNCPGVMKCCSTDMRVYIKEGNYYTKRNKSPTNGYCIEKHNPDDDKKKHPQY